MKRWYNRLMTREQSKGNTAQRASGDFARHLLANFPSEPVSYLPARILRAYFPRYFGKILENPQRIFSVFPFISQKIWRRNLHTSDTKQTLIFHKNAREYIKYSLRFLFHLTKNLTTHLSHNLCAVLPLSDDFLIIKRALCLAYCGHSAFSFVKIQSARAFYMSMFKNGIFHNVKFVKNAGEGEN